jgi:hypothetical protein
MFVHPEVLIKICLKDFRAEKFSQMFVSKLFGREIFAVQKAGSVEKFSWRFVWESFESFRADKDRLEKIFVFEKVSTNKYFG